MRLPVVGLIVAAPIPIPMVMAGAGKTVTPVSFMARHLTQAQAIIPTA